MTTKTRILNAITTDGADDLRRIAYLCDCRRATALRLVMELIEEGAIECDDVQIADE